MPTKCNPGMALKVFFSPQFVQMMEQYIDQGTTATFHSCNSSFMNHLTIIITQSEGKQQR